MKPRPASVKRAALWLFITLLALLLIGILIAAVCFRQLLGQINYVDPATTPTLSQEQLDAYLGTDETDFTTPPLQPDEVEFEEHETQISGSNILNILLIGQDRREGETRSRSDTMILCTFNKTEKTLTLTSFLRDLYVAIPGYRNNRINAAYAAGGMPLLGKTLEKNFGIQIDGNVQVDFTQFSDIIDLLGGVTLALRQDEADFINGGTSGPLTAGTQLLNGQQALAYARIRKLDSDGDFSRTNRQRKLLEALLESYKNAGLTTLLPLLEEILPMVTTDMTQEELLELAKELLPLLPNIQIKSQHIPADGTYSYRTIRGMSVLVADMDAARQLLEETLLGASG